MGKFSEIFRSNLMVGLFFALPLFAFALMSQNYKFDVRAATGEPLPSTTPTPSATPNDFVFPSCSTLIGVDGDTHYGFGNPHQIVGENGQRYGSDDVYHYENGNHLQCFCPDEGNIGIQTNWLRSGNPLGIYGEQWNLGPYFYDTENIEFTCKAGTPAPTPTPGPVVQGFSNPSAPVCGASKPGKPTILSSVQNGGSVTLTWSAVPNATHYSIVYGDIPGKYSYGVANVGNVTSYTINGLTLGNVYHYGVIAVNDCMPGDPGEFSGGIGGGQVLGASTMAKTGSFEEMFYKTIMTIGATLSAFGLKGLKTAKKTSKK